MTWLTAVLLALNGAVLAILLALWWWTKLVNCQPKTIPEAAVRGLFYAARWLHALAETGDSAILAYRDMRGELCRPRAELYRRLKAEQGAHQSMLAHELAAANAEEQLEGGRQ